MDLQGWILAVAAEPFDAMTRLAFADWLEEAGIEGGEVVPAIIGPATPANQRAIGERLGTLLALDEITVHKQTAVSLIVADAVLGLHFGAFPVSGYARRYYPTGPRSNGTVALLNKQERYLDPVYTFRGRPIRRTRTVKLDLAGILEVILKTIARRRRKAAAFHNAQVAAIRHAQVAGA